MARGTYGSSNYLSRTAAVKTDAPLTLVCWVNSSAFTAHQTLLAVSSHLSTSHYGLDICVNTSGTPYARRLANMTAAYVTSQAPGPANLSTSTWHHVAGVFGATNSRYCYLDGAAGSQATLASTMTFTPSRTSCGLWLRNGVSNWCTYATIAEAAIYDVALTADEIAQLADGYSPLMVRPWDLLAYWPLVRGDGSGNEPDVIGGNTLTETGTVGVQTHVPKLILPRRSQRYMWAPAPTFSPRWVRSSHIISAGVQHA